MPHVTLKDIGKEMGVSVVTVSRALKIGRASCRERV